MELARSGWCGLLTWTGSPDEAFFEGTLLLGGVVLFAVLAVLILGYARSRARRSGLMVDGVFSLAELRRLRDQGELTIAQYDALRRQAIGDLRKTADRDVGPPAG